jgi:hypothetical protein
MHIEFKNLTQLQHRVGRNKPSSLSILPVYLPTQSEETIKLVVNLNRVKAETKGIGTISHSHS